MSGPFAFSRRRFVQALTAAGSVCLSLSCSALVRSMNRPGQSGRRQAPVVSFHLDQPYLDYTGTAEPYLAAEITGEPRLVSRLDDEALRRHFPYL